MWEFIFAFAHFFIMVLSQATLNTQGDGVWSTIDVDKCDTDIENEIMTFDVDRRMVNHTHEAIDAKIVAKMEIDDTFKLLIVVCKRVDGGCKHYANILDGMERILMKHAAKNLERAFACAGLDQKGFPIPEGTHIVKDYVMDYCELPTERCPYGVFEASIFVVKDDQKVGCAKAIVEYTDESDICS